MRPNRRFGCVADVVALCLPSPAVARRRLPTVCPLSTRTPELWILVTPTQHSPQPWWLALTLTPAFRYGATVRAVAQRVLRAAVRVEDETVGEIGPGLLVLVGVRKTDTSADATYIAEKLAGLRVFDDAEGRMQLSALDVGAGILVVSQFTLYGDARKGRRPSYTDAAGPDLAVALYEEVCERLRKLGTTVATGRFGAEMLIDMVGDGPVTILLDSERQF